MRRGRGIQTGGPGGDPATDTIPAPIGALVAGGVAMGTTAADGGRGPAHRHLARHRPAFPHSSENGSVGELLVVMSERVFRGGLGLHVACSIIL